MKTLETNKLAAAQPAKDPLPAHELHEDLRQKLWQLLLPDPDKPELAELGAASPGGTERHERTRETNARSGAIELSTAAYVLAEHLLQLSLYDTARNSVDTATTARNSDSNVSVNVRVAHTTETGGLATVEFLHPELGPLELSVELADGAARVTATVSSPQSAAVIQQGQALLAARLQRQGIALEVLDVVVVRKRGPGKPANRARQRARQEES